MSDTDGKRSVQGSHLNINTREEFGHQLTALREQARLTVRDVARRIDVPPATLGGYFAGRHLPPLKPPNLLRDLLRACGVTDQAEIEQWEATLRRIRRVPGKRPSGAPVPYRGLESFQPEDAEWFYGREDLTDLLVKRLVEVSGSGQVMIVVGPSGSGKSSLLRAGLISALRQGSVEGPDPDVGAHLLFTPGGEPLAEFAQHLAALTNADVNGVRSRLHEDPRSVVDLIRGPAVVQAEAETDGTRSGALLIVVDQFEEVFTACSDPRERQAFLTALWAAAEPDACGGELGEGQSPDDPKPAALVVLGLRADFYDRALRYPQLAAALQEAQVVVGPMTEPQLRRAIVEPAHRANSDIEDGLVEVLLRDLAPTGDRAAEAAHDPGSLPLLSHALLATWERGHRRRLTTAGYKETGGIRGAVARTADDAYRALSGEQRDIARQIFLRLVHVSDDVADTRRRTNRSELSFQNPGAQFVLDQFVSQRLVTVDEDRVEISHEALLAAWPRLREWIDADRAGLRTHRQLTVAAEAWHDAGRDRHALYRAGRLATAREWAAEPAHLAALNQLEQEFFDASVAYDLAEAQVARRRTRVLLQLVAALAVLTLAAGALAVTAFQQRTAANHQRDLAISRQLATVANQLRPTDVSLAMQLSLAAYRIAPTPEARSSLLESYIPPAVTRVIGRAGVMQSVTTTPDRRTLVTAGPDFKIHLWDLEDPGHPAALGVPLAGHTNTIFSLAVSPDGRILASGSGDKTVRLWDMSQPHHVVPVGTLTDTTNTVYSVAFSPDSHVLAAASADGTVRLWTLASLKAPIPLGAPLRGAGGYMQSVAFSGDGHLLAAGTADNTLLVWDITDPSRPVALGPPLAGPTKTVFSVAFSPDSRRLAAGSGDNRVWLWDVPQPGRPTSRGTSITGPKGWANFVAFSPDGRDLAAASSDGKLWLWDAATGMVITTLPHPGPVTGLQFLDEGSRLVTSSGDGMARIWQLPGPTLPGAAENTFNVAFGTGNHVLAVAPDDNTATLWDVRDPRRPRQLGPTITNTTVSGRTSGAATLSPDARTLAVGTADGAVQLWDVSNPVQPVPLPIRLKAHTQAIQAITFDPTGKVLGVSSNDRTASLWDISDPRRPSLLAPPLTGPTNYAYSPTFSPDGRIFGVGTADNKVWLWDVSDLHHPVLLGRPLTGPASYVFTVLFSPDGRTLAAGSADNTVRLWDMTDPHHPTPLGAPLVGPENYVTAIAFSSDGRKLAAAGGDGSVWVWGLDAQRRPQVLATLTGSAGTIFTIAFDTDRPVLAAGGADKVVRLWDTDPEDVAGYICSIVGDSITPSEWTKYVSGLPYRRIC